MFLRYRGPFIAAVAVLLVGSLAIAEDDLPTVTIEGIQAPDQVACCPCANCRDGCAGCGPAWLVQSDALFLNRSKPHDRVIITDSAGQTLFNANEFDPGISAGWDISLKRQNILGSPWSIEGVYFGLDGWNADRGIERSAKGAVIPFIEPIGNFLYPVDVSASYHSALHNVELNAWRPVGNWGQLLIGFRYLDLSENGLNLTTPSLSPFESVREQDRREQPPQRFSGRLRQRPLVANRLSLEGCVKAGIYDNHATNSVFITQDGPFVYTSSAKTDHAAFVGSLALRPGTRSRRTCRQGPAINSCGSTASPWRPTRSPSPPPKPGSAPTASIP